jgi:hypothetical protein
VAAAARVLLAPVSPELMMRRPHRLFFTMYFVTFTLSSLTEFLSLTVASQRGIQNEMNFRTDAMEMQKYCYLQFNFTLYHKPEDANKPTYS